MAKSSLSFSNLVEGLRQNSFSGFSISADDPRDLAENLENGVFDNINLYDTGFEANSGLGNRLSGFLEGREVGVYAQGTQIAETTIADSDLRVGGSRETIKFSDTVKNLEDREFPVGSGTLDDLFQATGVKELSFKPVEKTKEKVSQVSKTKDSSLLVKAGLASAAALIILKVSS